MLKNAGELNLSAAKVDADQGCDGKTIKWRTTGYRFEVKKKKKTLKDKTVFLLLGIFAEACHYRAREL